MKPVGGLSSGLARRSSLGYRILSMTDQSHDGRPDVSPPGVVRPRSSEEGDSCVGDDWVTTSYNASMVENHSIKDEFRRLDVLKSYCVLGAQKEESFDRLTRLAALQFDAPYAVVALSEMGKVYFLSKHGLTTDDRDLHTELALCSQAIVGCEQALVVKNAVRRTGSIFGDQRIGSTLVHFFAGAPLLSPEGFKLGAICIADNKPRPQGLTRSETSILGDLAGVVVDIMVRRRNGLSGEQKPNQLIAHTAHDL